MSLRPKKRQREARRPRPARSRLQLCQLGARFVVAREQLVAEHFAELRVARGGEVDAIGARELRRLAQEAGETTVPTHGAAEREERAAGATRGRLERRLD